MHEAHQYSNSKHFDKFLWKLLKNQKKNHSKDLKLKCIKKIVEKLSLKAGTSKMKPLKNKVKIRWVYSKLPRKYVFMKVSSKQAMDNENPQSIK